MPTILPPAPLLSAFLIASLTLALTPGPSVFYILTRSMTQGRIAGLTSAVGVALGSLCNATAAALGLAALFALSPLTLMVVKYAGAVYLTVLGILALRSSSRSLATPGSNASTKKLRIFRDAFTVALLNPSTLVFFAVFLPQFLTAGQAAQTPVASALTLGCLFILIAVITDSLYALAASGIQPWLVRRGGGGRLGKIIEGTVFIALGLFAALGQQHMGG